MTKFKDKKRILFMLAASAMVVFILVLMLRDMDSTQFNKEKPVIENGFLDLSDWDFEQDGNVTLNGEWEFYWNRFVDPLLFSKEVSSSLTGANELTNVPSNWNKGAAMANDYGKGFGTYHLKIKVNPQMETYGFKIQSIRSSHKFFVNGVEVGASGNPSDSVLTRVMGNVPYAAHFSSEGAYLDIVIHVSEYENFAGGLVKPIYFGLEESISLMNKRLVFFDTLTAAALLITGIVFGGLYLYWRRDKSALYLSLYCLTFTFFVLAYDQRIILQMLPSIPFELAQKVLHVSIFMSFSFILLFMNASNTIFFSKKMLKGYLVFYGVFTVFMLLTPYSFYVKYTNSVYLVALFSYIMVIFNIIKVLVRKKYSKEDRGGARILLFSSGFITLNLVSGILDVNNVLYHFVTSQVSIFLFVGVSALYIAKRYSDAYSKIEKLIDELKEVDHYKDEFLVYTAHEFKTPLNGIINITQAIIESQQSALSEDQFNNLDYVRVIATRLSGLVNDLLDMQSIKDNKFKLYLTAVDISTPLQLVIDVLRKIYRDKDVKIINQVPLNTYYVMADEYRLRQIFNNLIGNAIKYTEQGQVSIRAQVVGKSVQIYIEDTGMGIEEANFESVFEYFEYSASSTKLGHHSSGVGLPLSRRLANQMKGNISLAKSVIGIGTEFCLSLPLAEYDATLEDGYLEEKVKRAELSDAIKHKTPAYTILVVDDEAINIEAVKALLGPKNYKIVSAYSGQQSLDLLEHPNNIDLILLDVMMPGLSGFETLLRIREHYTAIELPVFIMSIKNDSESIAYGLTIGANDYLTKPFEANELMARIENCIQIKETYKKMVNYELSFLQAQIKPHFIFNALSIIASLSIKEPRKAKEIVLDLADYLRLSFDFDNNSGLTTLENELSLVKAYLSIEQARFTNRLNVVYDVDENIDCTLPVLCIQPLVENAVRHSIMKNMSTGSIAISVKWVGSHIIIAIQDNGPGIDLDSIKALLSNTSSKGHVGIRNINNRLNKLYNEGLTYEKSKEAGTKVSFKIPYVSKEEVNEYTDR